MAKIKHTKNELKAQKEALTRFERFLPMLQLKKQQLQSEIAMIDAGLAENRKQDEALRAELKAWVALFAEPAGIEDILGMPEADKEEGNIAGVPIPMLKGVTQATADYDLYETPAWVDDAVETVGKLTELRVEREVLDEQKRLIGEELRTTSQRVNLFEKVKIPDCRENIRVIKIFLGDEQTAAVARAKIAKSRD